MGRLNAVSLSIAGWNGKLSAVAYLSDREDDKQTMLQVDWQNLGIDVEGLDPATWLLRALEAVVTNFDDHVVSNVDVVGSSQMQEDTDA